MYAVIETGGKQYRVQLGTEIAVERLDVQPGETVEIDQVLLVADGDQPSIGRPLVEGARVTASVLRQDRGDKIVVFKYRPKARHRAKQGHRQEQTVLRIADIRLGDRSAAQQAEAEAARRRDSQAEAAEEAARQAAADAALAQRLAREADSEAPTDAGARRTTRAGRGTTTAPAVSTEPATTAEATTAEPAATAGSTTGDVTAATEVTLPTEPSSTIETAATDTDDTTKDE